MTPLTLERRKEPRGRGSGADAQIFMTLCLIQNYSVFLRRRSTIKPRNATARTAQMMRTIDGSIESPLLAACDQLSAVSKTKTTDRRKL
jgi:hypothetical protein